MAGPGKAVDRLGQQAADRGGALQGGADDVRFAVRAHGCTGRLLEVADRGADRPGAQFRPQTPQPPEAEFGLAAALAAEQFMPFIDHHGPQPAEQPFGMGAAQQQGERFRGGDQDLGGRLELAAALSAGGVAVAQAHPQGPAHRLDRFADRQGQVAAEGPQRGEDQQGDAKAARPGLGLLAPLALALPCGAAGSLRFPLGWAFPAADRGCRNRSLVLGSGQELGDWPHHCRIGFAGASGHLHQAATALQEGLPAAALEGHRGPALALEPGLDRCQGIGARGGATLLVSRGLLEFWGQQLPFGIAASPC